MRFATVLIGAAALCIASIWGPQAAVSRYGPNPAGVVYGPPSIPAQSNVMYTPATGDSGSHFIQGQLSLDGVVLVPRGDGWIAHSPPVDWWTGWRDRQPIEFNGRMYWLVPCQDEKPMRIGEAAGSAYLP